MLPMGWGGPHGAACAPGGSSPSGTAPCPPGLGARGEPPGVWPLRDVPPPRAWPFGVWPFWGHGLWGVALLGMALLLDVCQLKDLLRLCWCLCCGWGGPRGGRASCPPGKGPGSTPSVMPRPFRLRPRTTPIHLTPPTSLQATPPSRYSCSFIGQCSGPCSQSGASVGGGQRTEKGPFGGRAVTTQGGDNTGR